MAGALKTDTIVENTSNTGVTIDGVVMKDSAVTGLLPVAAVLAGATDAIVIDSQALCNPDVPDELNTRLLQLCFILAS